MRTPRRRNEKVLPPLRPSIGLAVAYRKKMESLIEEMCASVERWIMAAYRKEKPLAMDADPAPPKIEVQYVGGVRPWVALINGEILQTSKGARIRFGSEEAAKAAARRFIGESLPADALQAATADLADYWLARFDVAARRMARYFAKSVAKRTDTQMKRILRDGGISVRFQMTPAQSDILQATIHENVALIRSIPQQYHTQVEGMVMRSVSRGRDANALYQDIRKQFGVTKRRAALIARDQNNKVTSALEEARRKELGIKEAIWMHSHGGKEPRPTHVAMDGKRYKVDEGMYDPAEGRNIWPGELINCFPAGTRIEHAHLVEKAYRHRYRGDLTEIVTASGETLSATVNHPVMTPAGWRAAGLLNEGDYVVHVCQEGIDGGTTENRINDRVPTIDEIFVALQNARASKSRIALGGNFHGDATDGDVDVVDAARFLTFGWNPSAFECFDQFGLALPDLLGFRSRLSTHFLRTRLRSAARRIGSNNQSLAAALIGLAHTNKHSIAAIADGSSCAFNPSFDGGPLMPSFSGQSQQAFSGLVFRAKTTRIVRVKRHTFSGHVYNLQTKYGWYVAGGIIVHNCRCVSRSVIEI